MNLPHSPGPWRDGGKIGHNQWIVSAGGSHVAVAYGSGVNACSAANVRLIVAAPRMLATLKCFVDAHDDFDPDGSLDDPLTDIVAVARGLIADVDGE